MKVLIISVDSDIGDQIAYQHIQAGDEVLATSRNKKTRFHLQLAHPLTWPKFEGQEGTFDRIYYTIGVGDGSASRIEVMQVNCYMSLDCIVKYEPMLKDGGQMVVFTSGWSSITELRSGKAPVYRMSKAALNMGVAIQANKNSRVQWVLVHPGLVDTKMTKYLNSPQEMLTPEQSAQAILSMLPNVTKHFSFMEYTGREIPF